MRTILSKLNLVVFVALMICYTFYIVAYGFLNWYSADVKWVYYLSTGTALIYFTMEEIAGYIDDFQRQFNIISKLTIAVNFMLFALNLQGVLSNPVLCLLALYGSVIVITIGIVYNLRKYEYLQ